MPRLQILHDRQTTAEYNLISLPILRCLCSATRHKPPVSSLMLRHVKASQRHIYCWSAMVSLPFLELLWSKDRRNRISAPLNLLNTRFHAVPIRRGFLSVNAPPRTATALHFLDVLSHGPPSALLQFKGHMLTFCEGSKALHVY